MSVPELEKYTREKQETLTKLKESQLMYEVAYERNQHRDPTAAQILAKKLDIVRSLLEWMGADFVQVTKEIQETSREISSATSLLGIKSDHKKAKLQDIF